MSTAIANRPCIYASSPPQARLLALSLSPLCDERRTAECCSASAHMIARPLEYNPPFIDRSRLFRRLPASARIARAHPRVFCRCPMRSRNGVFDEIGAVSSDTRRMARPYPGGESSSSASSALPFTVLHALHQQKIRQNPPHGTFDQAMTAVCAVRKCNLLTRSTFQSRARSVLRRRDIELQSIFKSMRNSAASAGRLLACNSHTSHGPA